MKKTREFLSNEADWLVKSLKNREDCDPRKAKIAKSEQEFHRILFQTADIGETWNQRNVREERRERRKPRDGREEGRKRENP